MTHPSLTWWQRYVPIIVYLSALSSFVFAIHTFKNNLETLETRIVAKNRAWDEALNAARHELQECRKRCGE